MTTLRRWSWITNGSRILRFGILARCVYRRMPAGNCHRWIVNAEHFIGTRRAATLVSWQVVFIWEECNTRCSQHPIRTLSSVCVRTRQPFHRMSSQSTAEHFYTHTIPPCYAILSWRRPWRGTFYIYLLQQPFQPSTLNSSISYAYATSLSPL